MTNSRSDRVAVYCGTRNIYADMVVSAKSLLCHSDVERIVFLTEDDAFPSPLPDCIMVRNVSGQGFFRHDGPNYNCSWTWMVMMRTALHREFPELDTVLSLDADTICLKDASPIFRVDLGGMCLAAVHDTGRREPWYLNGGVMLLNLRELRRTGIGDAIVRELDTVPHTFTDQEVVSELCRGRTVMLPGDWNASKWTVPTDNVIIRHFAAETDWRDNDDVVMYRDMEWKEVMKLHEQPIRGERL